MKQAGTLLFVGLLLCLLVACDPDGNTPTPSSQKLTLDFIICEPEHWQYVETRSLDVNSDGDKEWIILYYFDQTWPSGAKQHGNPIAAYVYRPDDNCPPNFFAHKLNAPGDDYLCECECTPRMEDLLSGFAGPELVVRDRCDGERTRLTIFQWDAAGMTYLPRGHFHGHEIEVEKDEVRVEERQVSRAQLAVRLTYRPDYGQMYCRDDQGTLIPPIEREIVFSHDEPEDVTLSPYPEKIVLAFYYHYTDVGRAPTYFAEGAWERLGHCDTGRCGCVVPRSEIAHVRVTSLQPVEDPGLGPDRAAVDTKVICERPDGTTPDGEMSLRWHLVRTGGRWQLADVQ